MKLRARHRLRDGDLGSSMYERSTTELHGIQHRMCDRLDCADRRRSCNGEDEHTAHGPLRSPGLGDRLDVSDDRKVRLSAAEEVQTHCRMIGQRRWPPGTRGELASMNERALKRH